MHKGLQYMSTTRKNIYLTWVKKALYTSNRPFLKVLPELQLLSLDRCYPQQRWGPTSHTNWNVIYFSTI